MAEGKCERGKLIWSNETAVDTMRVQETEVDTMRVQEIEVDTMIVQETG